MKWSLILKDGSRHSLAADIHYEVIRGTKLISGASSLDGDTATLHRAFEEGESIIESPHGHQHRVAIDMTSGRWRVRGLGG